MWDVLTEAKSIAAGGTYTTDKVKLYSRIRERALQYEITGSGSCDISFYTGIDGRNWIDNGIKIKAITKTHGPSGDGKDILPVRLKPGEYCKAEFTATTATITITSWFLQK